MTTKSASKVFLWGRLMLAALALALVVLAAGMIGCSSDHASTDAGVGADVAAPAAGGAGGLLADAPAGAGGAGSGSGHGGAGGNAAGGAPGADAMSSMNGPMGTQPLGALCANTTNCSQATGAAVCCANSTCTLSADCPQGGYLACEKAADCDQYGGGKVCCDAGSMKYCTKPSGCAGKTLP
jgi:hypothetical protein